MVCLLVYCNGCIKFCVFLLFFRLRSAGVPAERPDLLFSQNGGALLAHCQTEYGVQSAGHQRPAESSHHSECRPLSRWATAITQLTINAGTYSWKFMKFQFKAFLSKLLQGVMKKIIWIMFHEWKQMFLEQLTEVQSHYEILWGKNVDCEKCINVWSSNISHFQTEQLFIG